MDITIHQAIEQIDSYARPFIVHFVKPDGSIRQMVAVKRNRITKGKSDQKAAKGTKFKYMLNEKNLLLVNELTEFGTVKKQVKGTGTVHELVNRPNLATLKMSKNTRIRPVNIKIHSIIEFNGKKVWA